MFKCIKRCIKKLFQFNSIKNEVNIYNHIITAQEKETLVFEETLKFLEDSQKNMLKNYENRFIRDFYYFELLVEMLNRFKIEICFSDKTIGYLNYAFEEYKIAFRFNMIGYYNSAHIHLRVFMENIVNFVYNYCIDKNLFENDIKDNKKKKIEKCFKSGLEQRKKITPGEEFDEFYLNPDEYYKIYKYLSNNYIHKSNDNKIIFNEKEFNDFFVTSHFTLYFSGRFINICLFDKINIFQYEKILKPIEEYKQYGNYIKYLIGFNSGFTNYYSGFYNIIHDNNKQNYDLIINKIGLDLEKIMCPKFVKNSLIDEYCRKHCGKDLDLHGKIIHKYNKKQNKIERRKNNREKTKKTRI